MDKTEKKTNSAEEPAPGGGDAQVKLLLMVVLGISLLAPLGAAVFTVKAINQNVNTLKPTPTPGETKEGEKEAGSPAMEFFDPMEFLVNLADSEESHYLKTTVSLGLVGSAEDNAKPASGGGEHGKKESALLGRIKAQEPVVRDTVISIISSRKFRDLGTVAGKNELKQTLKVKLKDQLKVEDVSVYFTSFTLQ
jgi:flagellar basal body-associated protein FliL